MKSFFIEISAEINKIMNSFRKRNYDEVIHLDLLTVQHQLLSDHSQDGPRAKEIEKIPQTDVKPFLIFIRSDVSK